MVFTSVLTKAVLLEFILPATDSIITANTQVIIGGVIPPLYAKFDNNIMSINELLDVDPDNFGQVAFTPEMVSQWDTLNDGATAILYIEDFNRTSSRQFQISKP